MEFPYYKVLSVCSSFLPHTCEFNFFFLIFHRDPKDIFRNALGQSTRICCEDGGMKLSVVWTRVVLPNTSTLKACEYT